MKKLLLSLAVVAAGVAAHAQISAGSMMFGGTIGFGTGSSETEVSGSPIAAQNGTTDGPSTSNFTLSPTFGYFLKDNVAVGVALNFGTNTTSSASSFNTTTGAISSPANNPLGPNDVAFDLENKTSGFGVTLFANMYNEINDKWMWFYGGNLNFNNGSGTITRTRETSPGSGVYTTYDQDQPSTTSFGLGANLGVLHFLNDNWALQAGLTNLVALNYTMTSSETSTPPVTVKSSSSNLGVTLGTGSFGLGALNVGVFYFLR